MSTVLLAAGSAVSVAPHPPRTPLEELARIRGAMWTARGPLPWGPRPGQPDNCICIDYFECFTPDEQDLILALYHDQRGYTHAPMGPLVDPGYHGLLPATDWRAQPEVYFAAARKLSKGGVEAIHFVRPDRGVDGLDWTVDDLDRELGSIFRSPIAQATMQIVCLGWEPGPKYFYDNDWWREMCAWLARTFPQALRLIHMVADCDAPVGGDDDKKGISNGQGWANVAPFLHGYLAQYAGYTDGRDPIASAEFCANFQAALADLVHRFTTGGPDGTWPRTSAWGDGRRLKVYAGEYAAYGDFWKNFPESESRHLGDLAMVAGADGYLDGGAAAVPRR